MRKLLALSILTILTLASCNQVNNGVEGKMFCFDTVNEIKLYDGDENNLKDVKDIFDFYDRAADNYNKRGENNVFVINNIWNEPYQYDDKTYEMVRTTLGVMDEGAHHFSPMIGSLAKLWKNKLKDMQIPDENEIQAELKKMATSHIELRENNYIARIGQAELDLGGIEKGYTLDMVQNYLKEKGKTNYLINAGQSSILLGEKKSDDGLFNVGLTELDNSYLKLKNCFVSTSGTSEQGVTIDGVTYSHIIDPLTGSAINPYDAVIVISNKGYFGDAMSTSLMLSTLEEIKDADKEYDIEVIVIKNKEILYKSESLEILHH